MRKLLLFCITITLHINFSYQQKFLQDMPSAKIIQKYNPIYTHIEEDEKLIKFTFKDVSFQISSQMFLANHAMSSQDLFDKSKYQQQVDDYCEKYPTSIEAKMRSIIAYEEEFQVLKYSVFEGLKKNNVYIFGSNSVLYKYMFDRINIKLLSKYNVRNTIIPVSNTSSLDSEVELLELNGTLLIITSSHIYGLDQANITDHFYHISNFTQGTRIVDAGVFDDQAGLFWVCEGRAINIFELNHSLNQHKLTTKKSFVNFTRNTISAVKYDKQSKLFFAVSANILYIFNAVQQQSNFKQYDLDTNCDSVKVSNITLYLTCSFNKIRFVTQVLLQNKQGDIKATLNRYYDEDIVQGIQSVQIFGNNRIAIIGQQVLTIIGQSVNRNVLLELADNGKQQVHFMTYSFGLIDIFHLDEYSTLQQSTILIISDESMEIDSFFYVPPEIQCIFQRSQLGTTVSLLAVFNISMCPSQYQSQDQKGGALTICQIYFPHEVAIGVRQYQYKTARLILFMILLALSALILLCIGCGFNIRKKANQTLQILKDKLEKVKKTGKKRKT